MPTGEELVVYNYDQVFYVEIVSGAPVVPRPYVSARTVPVAFFKTAQWDVKSSEKRVMFSYKGW